MACVCCSCATKGFQCNMGDFVKFCKEEQEKVDESEKSNLLLPAIQSFLMVEGEQT